MAEYLFDQKEAKKGLKEFFKNEKAQLTSFGNAVNQTFEAYVFAKVIEYYKNKNYKVTIVNPKVDGKEVFKLKFSTRGAPNKYSYALLEMDGEKFQLRHQLRISTTSNSRKLGYKANICCDISIIKDQDLKFFTTNDSVSNDQLVSFGEVKHMSAFAELVANFIGLAHELTPKRLKRTRIKGYVSEHIPPFLYVSGFLNPTAEGIQLSIKKRKYDLDVYSHEFPMK